MISALRIDTNQETFNYRRFPMRARSLHIFITLAATAATALALAAAPAAQAANPQVNHFEFAFGFTWTDFCGTGSDVEVSGAYHGTEFLAPNQPVDERVKLEGKTVYVNPLNGRTVTLHIAGTTWSTAISGDPRGLHVIESTTKGLGASLRADGGGVLIRDAGYVTVRETYNGDQLVSREFIVDRGGHPILASDFFGTLCTVVPSNLGLT
jgi:hypothetical protein